MLRRYMASVLMSTTIDRYFTTAIYQVLNTHRIEPQTETLANLILTNLALILPTFLPPSITLIQPTPLITPSHPTIHWKSPPSSSKKCPIIVKPAPLRSLYLDAVTQKTVQDGARRALHASNVCCPFARQIVLLRSSEGSRSCFIWGYVIEYYCHAADLECGVDMS